MDKFFSVKNKVVVVTGGGRGIGYMIAKAFVSAGSKVYIVSRSLETLEKTAKELTQLGPGSCHPISIDLGNAENATKLAKELSNREKSIHVLVNNSGAIWGAPIDNYPIEAFDKVINLNLKSPFYVTVALLPLLKAAATKEDPARVINISSINGTNISPLDVYAYTASKAGLIHMGRQMAMRLGRDNITVNSILPGVFETKMMKATLEKFKDNIINTLPLKRTGQMEDIGGACIYFACPAAAWITGASLAVDGGALVTAAL